MEPLAELNIAVPPVKAPVLMFKDEPVAAPILGVVNVGDVANTTDPLPVDVVAPVPPFATGSAVPDRESANVPEVTIGLPETLKNAGTVIATEVTVPVAEVNEHCASHDAVPVPVVDIQVRVK